MSGIVSAIPLIERLPKVRGRLRANESMAAYTWFRVGGPAEVLFKPADFDDFRDFLAGCPADVPVTVIGMGSNLLVRDGGLPGVAIRLGGPFARATAEGTRLTVGAGALDSTVSATACEAGIAGLEFLCGVPGTIGGALRMNAGAYETEMKDIVREATAIDRAGNVHPLDLAGLGFSYRHCGVPEDWFFTQTVLEGRQGDPDAIGRRMAEIRAERESSQPIHSRTGGSTFANPPGHSAWRLIDQAGCRGLSIGGAQVSERHCNFLINTGAATAADIENLGEEVRRRVKETSGIDLRWEIRRVGVRKGQEA